MSRDCVGSAAKDEPPSDRGRSFHFFTLVTRDDQYGPMRDSLAEVGFDEGNSLFTALDNRRGNAHEPYSAIRAAVRDAQAPYVVFCHQDLLFQRGPDDLLRAIREVEALDPDWAVVGNSGLGPDLTQAICVDDSTGSHDSGAFPAMALSLDEDLLIVRRDSGVGCSPGLSGFHLYGTDLCLNAYLGGGSAWVVDYRLRHLGTTLDFDAVHELAPRFHRVWRDRLRGAVLFTPAMVLVFSRVPGLFALLNRKAWLPRFLWHRRHARTLDYLLRHGRPAWLPMARYPDGDPRGPLLGMGVMGFDALLRRGRPRWPEGQRYHEVAPESSDAP